MSQTYVRSQTGAGSSNWIQLNQFGWPNVTLQVAVTGTANWTIEGTNSDLQGGATAVVFAHPTLAAQTASKFGAWDDQPAFIRITVNSGTGSVELRAIQAGLAEI